MKLGQKAMIIALGTVAVVAPAGTGWAAEPSDNAACMGGNGIGNPIEKGLGQENQEYVRMVGGKEYGGGIGSLGRDWKCKLGDPATWPPFGG